MVEGLKESVDNLGEILRNNNDDAKPHQKCMQYIEKKEQRLHDRVSTKLSSWIWGATAIAMLTILISGLVMMTNKVDKADYKDDIKEIKADIKVLIAKASRD